MLTTRFGSSKSSLSPEIRLSRTFTALAKSSYAYTKVHPGTSTVNTARRSPNFGSHTYLSYTVKSLFVATTLSSKRVIPVKIVTVHQVEAPSHRHTLVLERPANLPQIPHLQLVGVHQVGDRLLHLVLRLEPHALRLADVRQLVRLRVDCHMPRRRDLRQVCEVRFRLRQPHHQALVEPLEEVGAGLEAILADVGAVALRQLVPGQQPGSVEVVLHPPGVADGVELVCLLDARVHEPLWRLADEAQETRYPLRPVPVTARLARRPDRKSTRL